MYQLFVLYYIFSKISKLNYWDPNLVKRHYGNRSCRNSSEITKKKYRSLAIGFWLPTDGGNCYQYPSKGESSFFSKENSLTVKLLESTDESSMSFALSKKGGGLNHLCFKCNDMDEELVRCKEKGLRVLTDPQPGEAFEN